MAIVGFRHKGLERFFTRETTAEIQRNHAERLRLILGRLSVAKEPRDMDCRVSSSIRSRETVKAHGRCRLVAIGESPFDSSGRMSRL